MSSSDIAYHDFIHGTMIRNAGEFDSPATYTKYIEQLLFLKANNDVLGGLDQCILFDDPNHQSIYCRYYELAKSQ